jgi:hypothetical protein
VRGWLNSIGAENRSLLRHLELTFLNTERAISSLDVHYQMRPAKESVVVENVMWDDGQMGEMEWHVFTALNTVTASRVTDEDAKSIETSLLFEIGEVNYDANLLGLDAGASEDDWETTRTSGESSRRLLAPTTPPQVQLMRKNGEAFGNPRWSFAGKFNDHLSRRLASCKLTTHVLFYSSKLTLCSEPRSLREDASKAGGVYCDARRCCRVRSRYGRRQLILRGLRLVLLQ